MTATFDSAASRRKKPLSHANPSRTPLEEGEDGLPPSLSTDHKTKRAGAGRGGEEINRVLLLFSFVFFCLCRALVCVCVCVCVCVFVVDVIAVC